MNNVGLGMNQGIGEPLLQDESAQGSVAVGIKSFDVIEAVISELRSSSHIFSISYFGKKKSSNLNKISDCLTSEYLFVNDCAFQPGSLSVPLESSQSVSIGRARGHEGKPVDSNDARIQEVLEHASDHGKAFKVPDRFQRTISE